MDMIALVQSTGHPLVDTYLRGLLALFEALFPARIRAYYLVGSFATGGTVRTSDIDLRVIFKDRFVDGEAARVEAVCAACQLISAFPLDLPLRCEDDFLAGRDDPSILRDAVFLYGTDIRAQLPALSFNEYLRVVTGAPYRNMVVRLRKRQVVTYPLTYPDPQDEFYGYVANATQQFVVTIGWAASCIIGMTQQRYVTKKSDWLPLYQQFVADEWTSFLTAVYETCRNQWEYAIPTAPGQRQVLRDLCHTALGFENYYLTSYRAHLLQELERADEASQCFALERFRMVLYRDSEVQQAVQHLTKSGAIRVRAAAEQTLQTLQHGADVQQSPQA